MLIPLIILSIGAIFAGFIFKDLFIGYEGINDFWNESIFFLEPLSTESSTIMVFNFNSNISNLSIPFAYYLFVKNKNFTTQLVINKPLYEFLLNKWYFDEFMMFICKNLQKNLDYFCGNFLILKLLMVLDLMGFQS